MLVFPESCDIPNGHDFYNVDIFGETGGIREHAMDISNKLGCAVIIGATDINGYI